MQKARKKRLRLRLFFLRMLFLPHQRKKRGKKVIFIGLYKCNLQIVKILPRKYSAEVFLLKQNALQKERFAMLCGLLKYITIFRKKKVLRKKSATRFNKNYFCMAFIICTAAYFCSSESLRNADKRSISSPVRSSVSISKRSVAK